MVRDVRQVGGILTMEDLRHYEVKITDAMAVNAMVYTILGMPPPSSGTPGLALDVVTANQPASIHSWPLSSVMAADKCLGHLSYVLHILDSYGSLDAVKGPLGLHRLIEAIKHMFALRMNLGDPAFVNVNDCITDMLSTSFAKSFQQKIFDNTTFPPDYYMNRYRVS
ncbi:hypothetical protein NE237_025959 [Protea cynaroides]|uniref:Uncharacterized protein n=1 Tax=Protea cynaroides TaxID=273540 RepID=A0A9Q0K289_9MAGN|nr:hypothetical protein NE237_025959 [Protea cynaroides]